MKGSIVKNYRENEALRASFNGLAGRVFGLSFENWYRNGFWKENYIPYSVVTDGEVVSNVSVNLCRMNHRGRIVRLIQLGTVMTDPAYRGRGYARALMTEILKDYEDRVDGIYLFANDSVLDFYPKFGFRAAREYSFTKEVTIPGADKTVPVPMKGPEDYEKFVGILNSRSQNAGLYMVGNPGLYMFYLSQFMTENVFRIADCDTYAVAEREGNELLLHAVIGEGTLDEVIAAFGSEVEKVTLCFTPKDPAGFEIGELREEDTTFFVKGRFFEETRDEQYRMQAITHA